MEKITIKAKLRQVGLSLLEVLLALVIIALVLVMSIKYYQGARNAQMEASTLQFIEGIYASVNCYHGSSNRGYTGISVSSYPECFQQNLTTPWGEVFGNDNLTSTSPSSVTIKLLKMPQLLCKAVEHKMNVVSETSTKDQSGSTVVTNTCDSGELDITIN